MFANGNGKPETCAANLLKIIRSESPYERVKGLPADLVDKPADEAATLFVEAATWNLETYEPRLPKGTIINMATVRGSEAEVFIEIKKSTGRD
jgi:hypothetical protein